MVKITDIFDYKFLSHLELSPNKENAGFIVHNVNVKENKYDSFIWVYNRITNECKKITSYGQETTFRWLDDDTILFPGLRDKSYTEKAEMGEPWTFLYSIDINGGEANEYCRIPLNINTFEIITNKSFVLTATYDRYGINLHELEEEDKLRAFEEIREDEGYEIIEEIPFWSDGKGFISNKRNRLYLFNMESYKLTPITDEFMDVHSYLIKDNKIVYVGKKFRGKNNHAPGIYQYDMETKRTDIILEDNLYKIDYFNFINDKIFFIGKDHKKSLATDNPKFYYVENGEAKLWLDTDFSTRNTIFTDCRYGEDTTIRVHKNTIYLVSTHERSSFIKKILPSGEVEILSADNGSIDGFDVCDDEILFTGLRGLNLPEIYSLKNKEEKKLTNFNENALKDKKISIPETMVFENNGFSVHYVVLKPVDFDENKKYPGILYIHGGAKGVYGKVFFHEMQLL
ncbi:MAG: S9 family peptidase, partial [Clostridiales bacterium]|nr:S9 family peptidase [Clostridiales bacterium]